MIISVKDKTLLNEFIKLPESIYKGDPYWVKPLVGTVPVEFHANANPALKYHDMNLFLLQENSAFIGRVAAFVDKRFNHLHSENAAFFGFFECRDNIAAASELFRAVEGFAATRGMKKIIGPVEFSTNYQAGLLIDGYNPPTVMTPYNKNYYPKLLESNGFKKQMDLFAYSFNMRTPIPERLKRMAEIQKKRHPEISVQPLDTPSRINRAAVLSKLYDEAFADNWGFVPMGPGEFSYLLKTISSLKQSDLNYIAFSGSTPVGLLLTVPDLYSPASAPVAGGLPAYDKLRVTSLGVIPAFRSRGIESLLGFRTLSDACKKGYKELEFSVILENNTPMNNYVRREFGLPVSKTFRVYTKPVPMKKSGPDEKPAENKKAGFRL